MFGDDRRGSSQWPSELGWRRRGCARTPQRALGPRHCALFVSDIVNVVVNDVVNAVANAVVNAIVNAAVDAINFV